MKSMNTPKEAINLMRIDKTTNQQAELLKQLKTADTDRAQEQQGQERAGKSSGARESVEISSRAQEMKGARDALQALPDVRAEKVEQVKAQIEQGTYEVNGKQIAEKIIRDSLFNFTA
jgi:negative regulator of flagellin synthesis FlgM